jgi:hypothetical protein
MPPTVMTPWWTTGCDALGLPLDPPLEREPECVLLVPLLLPLDDDETLPAAGLLLGADTGVALPEVCACPFTAPVAGCTGVAAAAGTADAWPG